MRIAGTLSALALTAGALLATGAVPIGEVTALIPEDIAARVVAMTGLEPAKPAPAVPAQSPVPGCDRPGCPIEVVRTVSEVPSPVATVVSTLPSSETGARPSSPSSPPSSVSNPLPVLAVMQPAPRIAPDPQPQPAPTIRHEIAVKPEIRGAQAQPPHATPAAPQHQSKTAAANKPAAQPVQAAKRIRPEKPHTVGSDPEWTRKQVFERQT